MSVNVPHNPEQKEADIQRKLQIYGIYKAFQAGKAPSNEQIDITLNSFIESHALAKPSEKLSAEGQRLAKDFRNVVEQAKSLLLTKNHGELLQDFIWQCQKIDGGAATIPGAPVDQATAQQHGQQAKDGFKTIGQLIISNGQFRKLLNDAVILIRDIAGDAATNAAGKVKPSEEQLSQIDRPADDNVWHENPDMSSGNIKNQMKQKFNKNKPVDRDDVRDAVGNASQNAHPSGSRDPADAAQLAGRDQQYNTASGVDGQAGAQAGADTLRQRASDNVPEETKQRGRETRDRTKNYLREKVPEERRENIIYRLKKMVVEIQGHQDYMSAINTLLNLAEQYGGHAQTIGQHGSGAVKGAHTDNSLQTAERDLKTLLERFANYTSFDDLTDSINMIYRDADNDPQLKGWFKEMDQFIRKCLQEQGYIMEENSTQQWNQLYDRGEYLLRNRYRDHTDRIADEIKFLANEFDNDRQNKEFAETCNKFFNDLGKDENGKAKFKTHLGKDVANVIIPGCAKRIRYMPIPRLEYRDPKMELIIENLVIESDNLMPNLLNIEHESSWRFGRAGYDSRKRGSFLFNTVGVQMDLKDVSYYFNRKSNIPMHQDQGVLDIFLGGSGLSFKMKISLFEDGKGDGHHFFKVDFVKVDIKKFKLKIKESKHKALLTVGKSFMMAPLTKAIGKAVELAIKQKFEEADAFAYRIKLEADKVRKEAQNDPENIPNIYREYLSAIQREMAKGQKKAQKAQEAVQDKEFKMVMTMDESMFPNIILPGGISRKATEYKELAKQGDGWKSNVFGIGRAKPSNNFPTPKEVTRKPHSVAQGGLRSPQNASNTKSATGQSGYNGNQQGYPQQGYAQGGQQGYGQPGTNLQGAQQGYAQPGYAQGGQQSYAQDGFNQQVDAAFSNAGQHPTGTTLTNNGVSNGASNQQNINPATGHTQLGSKNPVFQGRV